MERRAVGLAAGLLALQLAWPTRPPGGFERVVLAEASLVTPPGDHRPQTVRVGDDRDVDVGHDQRSASPRGRWADEERDLAEWTEQDRRVEKPAGEADEARSSARR
jgi:hypothetical protein